MITHGTLTGNHAHIVQFPRPSNLWPDPLRAVHPASADQRGLGNTKVVWHSAVLWWYYIKCSDILYSTVLFVLGAQSCRIWRWETEVSGVKRGSRRRHRSPMPTLEENTAFTKVTQELFLKTIGFDNNLCRLMYNCIYIWACKASRP